MSAGHSRTPPSAHLGSYSLVLALLATLALGASLAWNVQQQDLGARAVALTLARATLEKDVLYRRWNAMHGGVYAPVGAHTPANPYLHVPERDITTPSGRHLTMINPAYMTRQVYELAAKAIGIHGHITSLKPIRPGNAPDAWERRALMQAEKGAKEVYEISTTKNGKPILRLLRPLYVEKSCLPCHSQQGYKVGQVRGGLRVTVPLGALWKQRNRVIMNLVVTHVLLWVLGMAFLLWGSRKLGKRIAERDQARQELRILSGLLPICSHCKKIRTGSNQWEALENYIRRHSEADFSHGLCPECVAKYYPELAGLGSTEPSEPPKQK